MAERQMPPRHGEGDRAKRGGGGSPTLHRRETYTARRLRKEMTLPEGMLWKRLRGKQTSFKFRRQHPVGPYVTDFYCASARLIIEIDGQAHDDPNRVKRDERREKFFGENGYFVLRLNAADVLEDIDWAVETIVARADSPLHQPLAGPPPRAGEAL